MILLGLSGYSSVPYHCLFRWRIKYIIKVVPVIKLIAAKRNTLTFLRLLCDIKVVSRIIRVAKGMVSSYYRFLCFRPKPNPTENKRMVLANGTDRMVLSSQIAAIVR